MRSGGRSHWQWLKHYRLQHYATSTARRRPSTAVIRNGFKLAFNFCFVNTAIYNHGLASLTETPDDPLIVFVLSFLICTYCHARPSALSPEHLRYTGIIATTQIIDHLATDGWRANNSLQWYRKMKFYWISHADCKAQKRPGDKGQWS